MSDYRRSPPQQGLPLIQLNPQQIPAQPDLRGVASNSNIFMAVGLGGTLYRSTDAGLSWQSVSSPTSKDLLAVTGQPRFVAVGAEGTIVRGSTSGASGTWAVVGVPLPESLHGIVYDGSRLFTVGDSEVIMSSTDGSIWIPVAVESTSWSKVKVLFRSADESP